MHALCVYVCVPHSDEEDIPSDLTNVTNGFDVWDEVKTECIRSFAEIRLNVCNQTYDGDAWWVLKANLKAGGFWGDNLLLSGEEFKSSQIDSCFADILVKK